MKKAYQLCESEEQVQDITMMLSDLECDPVERVFETTPPTDENTMFLLVERVVRKASGQSGNRTANAGIVDHDDDNMSNLLDATGDNAAPQILAREGIKVGALMVPRRKASSMELDVQYVVDYINRDGSIGLRRVDVNGGLFDAVTVVKMSNIPEYCVTKNDFRIKLSTLVFDARRRYHREGIPHRC